jgi:hypothetical protein
MTLQLIRFRVCITNKFSEPTDIPWYVQSIQHGLENRTRMQAIHSRNAGLQSPTSSIIPHWSQVRSQNGRKIPQIEINTCRRNL